MKTQARWSATSVVVPLLKQNWRKNKRIQQVKKKTNKLRRCECLSVLFVMLQICGSTLKKKNYFVLSRQNVKVVFILKGVQCWTPKPLRAPYYVFFSSAYEYNLTTLTFFFKKVQNLGSQLVPPSSSVFVCFSNSPPPPLTIFKVVSETETGRSSRQNYRSFLCYCKLESIEATRVSMNFMLVPLECSCNCGRRFLKQGALWGTLKWLLFFLINPTDISTNSFFLTTSERTIPLCLDELPCFSTDYTFKV